MKAQGKIYFNQLKKEQNDTEQKNKRSAEVRKLDKVVEGAGIILFHCKTFKPYTVFQDELTIDPYSVNFVTSEFFGSKEMTSFPVDNVDDIVVDTTPFFASVKITAKGFHENPIILKFIKKSQARKMKCILQGLKIAKKEDIDLSKIPQEQLVEKLQEIGKAQTIES